MSDPRLVIGTAALGLCAALGAQQKVLEAIGVEKQYTYAAFNFLGDLNGDGYEELGAHSLLPTHAYAQIVLVSGKHGTLMRKLVGPGMYMLPPAPAGDWNADGVPDYYAIFRDVARGRAPVSEIRSGKDDRLLEIFRPWSQSSQFSIAVGNVELDGDGRPDLVFHNDDPARRQESGLYAVSHSKRLLWMIQMPWVRRLWRTSSVGDVNRDGCDDIAAWDDWDTKNTIFVVSGRTGTMLYKVSGERPTDLLGSGEITTCGDVDGDGHDDFAAGSAGSASDGLAILFSGRTGKALFTWRKPRGGYFGSSISSGYDLDQDGVNDLVVGNLVSWPDGTGGRAHVFSLRTGKEIAVVRPTGVSQYTYFGGGVRLGSPRPGSPFPVFAVWDTYRFSTTRFDAPGRITLYHMLPAGVAPFGTACRGTLTSRPRIGINDKVGPGLRFHLSNAPSATAALFLLGLSDQRWGNVKLPLPLDPLGFVGCKLFTSVGAICPLRTGSTGLDKGYAFLDLPALPGVTLHGQWLVLGNGPLAPGATTSALRWKR